jgi:hypothetical protein
MPDCQRVIGHHALSKDLAVAFLCLLGLGKIVGEVGADEPFAGYAGDFGCRFIDVGDFAVTADGDERVERGLDQAAGILGHPNLIRNIFGDEQEANRFTRGVVPRCDHQAGGKFFAGFTLPRDCALEFAMPNSILHDFLW